MAQRELAGGPAQAVAGLERQRLAAQRIAAGQALEAQPALERAQRQRRQVGAQPGFNGTEHQVGRDLLDLPALDVDPGAQRAAAL